MLALTNNRGELINPEQLELKIDIPRRGNPNWRNKFRAGKTVPIRIPVIYQDQVKTLIARLDHPHQLAIDPTPIKESDPIGVKDIPIAALTIAPKIFQYKVVYGATGKTGSLNGVRQWDQNLAGLILVWYQSETNTTYVVNGHNRVDLAKSLGIETITVRYLDCPDPKSARMIGALANLAEGRGTAIDCAKFLRDSGLGVEYLKSKGIPLREKIVEDGLGLANLAPSIWDRVYSGELDQDTAIAIGSALIDHDQQIALIQLMNRDRRKLSKEVIKELAQAIQHEGFSESSEMTLFGIEYNNQSLAIERSQINALVKNRLSRDQRLLSTVSKSRSVETLARAGNKIEQLASSELSEKSRSALIYFDQFKFVSGELARLISELSRELASKKINLEAAADQVLDYLEHSADHWHRLKVV